MVEGNLCQYRPRILRGTQPVPEFDEKCAMLLGTAVLEPDGAIELLAMANDVAVLPQHRSGDQGQNEADKPVSLVLHTSGASGAGIRGAATPPGPGSADPHPLE